MRIAIDLRIFRLHGPESSISYLENLFSRIARSNPREEFFFLFDSPYPQRLIFSSNVTPILIKPKANGPLGWKYWYNFKLPRSLKNHHVDLLVAASGICSQTSHLPQILFVQDLKFMNSPADYSKAQVRFTKSIMRQQLQKAAKVMVMSDAIRQELLEQYKVDPGKIFVIPCAASDSSQALPWYEREYTKDKYAGGKDYFLFDGFISPAANILSLIKAFSQFKKWQQSNMKLLLVGNWSEKCHDVLEQLETFRFREDVVILEDPSAETRAKIQAAAYAMVDPSLYAGFGMNFSDAMRAETPVICSDIKAFQETAGEAAAFFEAGNSDALAEQLKKIYKDETWRQDLIEKGKERSRQYSFEDSAAQFWQEIINVGKIQST